MVKSGGRPTAGWMVHLMYAPELHTFFFVLLGIAVSVVTTIRATEYGAQLAGLWGAGCAAIVWNIMRRLANGAEVPEGIGRNVKGKTVVVTGATSGIGLATVRRLVEWGAHVVIAVRDVAAGARMAKELAASTATGTTEVIACELGDLTSVRACAQALRGREIHAIVCNAGIALLPEWRESSCGHEMQFSVNHMGHFVLINELLDDIVNNGTRVVVVSSLAHVLMIPPAPFDIAWVEPKYSKAYYGPGKAYAISKLCNLLFVQQLQAMFNEKKSKATAYALHPGFVATSLPHEWWKKGARDTLFTRMSRVCKTAFWAVVCATVSKDIDHGANTQLFLTAGDKDMLTPGAYYQECAPFPIGPIADDTDAQEAVWQYSVQLAAKA